MIILINIDDCNYSGTYKGMIVFRNELLITETNHLYNKNCKNNTQLLSIS